MKISLPSWPPPSSPTEWSSLSLSGPSPDGRFQLIAGERRWRASQLAGKATIPAILRQVSDEQAMEITIVENLQRADLNPMEQARAFERLSREFHMTQEQMATRTGKDRASVANFLRCCVYQPQSRPRRVRRPQLRPRPHASRLRAR
jgi:ParB/RepB/Spo0J family partition protein